MRTISATDAKQGLASLINVAQSEPVMIRRQNRDVAVIMSIAEYKKMCDPNAEGTLQNYDWITNKKTVQEIKEIVAKQNAHLLFCKPFPRNRFIIFRVYGSEPPMQYHEKFWSLDDEELAKDLCRFLVTTKLSGYVLDTVTQKKVLDLKAKDQ
ncbi:MAG TPA: type II toxin-antitoxin system Phd/YefM family antitoxin [Terriglobales bacterium]|jgi:prevent-host-death family protein